MEAAMTGVEAWRGKLVRERKERRKERRGKGAAWGQLGGLQGEAPWGEGWRALCTWSLFRASLYVSLPVRCLREGEREEEGEEVKERKGKEEKERKNMKKIQTWKFLKNKR
jgi:hypothetical protein